MTPRIECSGAALGELWVPPFRCAAGEFVCLHVPEDSNSAGHAISQYLTGQRAVAGWRVHGTALVAERPLPRRGFLGFTRNPRIGSWMLTEAKLSADQSRRILDTYAVLPATRIGLLSWSLRSILALEVALVLRAQLVVFDTVGLADNTIQDMYTLIHSRLGDQVFVHLTFGADAEHVSFPGGRCIHAQSGKSPQAQPA